MSLVVPKLYPGQRQENSEVKPSQKEVWNGPFSYQFINGGISLEYTLCPMD